MRSGFGGIIFGIILGLLIPALAAYAYFRFGYAPVATSAAPMPFEKMAAKMALKARINSEAPKSAPIPADEPNLLAGVQIYRQDCAVCHGEPGKAATNIAKGMFPNPPQLFVHTVSDDPVGTTYWKVVNGIRMTGMPAFKPALSDTQSWQVSLLLANADTLPASVLSALSQPMTGAANAPAAAPGTNSDTSNDKSGSISPKHSGK